MASRLAALDAVEASVDATELDEQQLMSWLGAVNNLRLVLGTMLDVSEELEIGELPDETPTSRPTPCTPTSPASSARSSTPSILADGCRRRTGGRSGRCC